MIAKVLQPKNLYKAYRQVVQNKGAAGVDAMTVDELSNLKDSHRKELLYSITNWKYIPQAILGTTITLARLKRKEYLSMLDYYKKMQTSIW